MKIPQGNFGSVVAEPQRQVMAPQDNQVTNALAKVGDTGMQIAAAMKHGEIVKQRAESAVSTASATNALHDLYKDTDEAVTTGRMKSEDAMEHFRTQQAEILNLQLEGLNKDQRQAADQHLIGVRGTLERNLEGRIIKRNQADVGASISTMGEQLQREAMRDLPSSIARFDQMVDLMGPHANLDQLKQTEIKQRFKEGAHFNFANATLEGAAQTGDIAMIRAARAKIEGPDGDALDPAKRTLLITRAFGFESEIERNNAREAEKAANEQRTRENIGATVFNKYFDQSEQGVHMSSDAIKELAEATAGTPHAGKAQELVKAQAQIAGFASKPIPVQQAEIERMRAAGATPGIGLNDVELQVLRQREKITAAATAAAKENPWGAAQKYGRISDAQAINLTNVQDAQQIIGQRMQQIDGIETWVGRKISPLQPDEARSIGRLVRSLPPDQQSSALASFGAQIGNADRLVEFAKQIDSNDKVLGTAMMFAGQQTTQGRYVSELILRGDRAITDKAIMIDGAKETGWRGAIATEIGDAYPNQEVRNRLIDAAYLIQAGFAAEGQGTDTSRAVRLAAGRIVERNGGKIPLPYGMEENDFDKRLKAIQPTDLAKQAPDGMVRVGSTPVPVADFLKKLPDAKLEHAGQGRYAIKAGMGYALGTDGKKLVIEVRK